MTDTTTSSPVDIQDPLPEASWLWRRVFVFVVTGVVLWFVWGAMDRLGQASLIEPRRGVPALLSLSKWLIGFAGVMSILYLIAPSAEQIVKTVQAAAMFKQGVQTAGTQWISPGGASNTQVTVGQPPAPPIPGAPAPQPPPAGPTQRGGHDGPPWSRT